MKMKYILTLLILPMILLFSCSNANYAEKDSLIVKADAVQELLDAGYKAIDTQKSSAFAKGHLKGAVNIERAAITINEPVPNTLAPADIVAMSASVAGITEQDDLIIYDSNANMDASRLYWTLAYYGHEGDIKIVSGGLNALKAEGLEISKATSSVNPTSYKTGNPVPEMIIYTEELEAMLDADAPDTVIIDVRTDDEYYAGTIPGSIHINYTNNNFKDGTFRPAQHIRILYKEHGIMPDDKIVMYCKTSIRAANTYAALYNAGYRNLTIYDSAWLGWEASGNRIYTPEKAGTVSISQQDNS